MKKTVVLFLIGLLMLGGCAKQQTEAKTSEAETQNNTDGAIRAITLPYFDGESLNPIITKSPTNLALTKLIFDSIIVLDENMNVKPGIVSDYNITDNKVTLTVKEGLTFHDGSRLSGEDVAYTLNKILQTPNSYYNKRLQNVQSVKAAGSRVEIILKKPDGLFINLLDIPVIQKNAGDFTTIGSGRYEFSKSKTRGEATLTAFALWRGEKMNISVINLLSLPESAATGYTFGSGELDAVNITPDRLETQSGYFAGSKQYTYTTTTMTFMGINYGNGNLTPEAARFISNAIERDKLNLLGATPTKYPVFPAFSFTGEITGAGSDEKEEDSDEQEAPKLPKLRLVVGENSGKTDIAKKIAERMRFYNIDITVTPLSSEAFYSVLGSGNFDLYLADITLLANMDFSGLLEGGSINYGRAVTPATTNALTVFSSSAKDMQQNAKSLVDAFDAEQPFIPICFKGGILVVNGSIEGNIIPTCSDPFYSIAEWKP